MFREKKTTSCFLKKNFKFLMVNKGDYNNKKHIK